MDVRELKNYIYENKYVEQVLESIGCHHMKYHASGAYFSAANPDGDNFSAIVIYNNSYLFCEDYTRQLVKGSRKTDIIDLICYLKKLPFLDGLKYICEEIGVSYYHNFEDDLPESFRILKTIDAMNRNELYEKELPLKPISEKILFYYKSLVNDLFYEDNIDYATQKEFEIGFDEASNRYTIPIRSEIGDLVGVKGRYFYREAPKEVSKYIYLEPCAKSKILYGLHKTIRHIKSKNLVYVLEAEKAVLQLWSYGYKNCVSAGGKELSQYQIEMLVRLGVNIVLALDKDVKKEGLEEIAGKFPDGVPIYYIYDEENILEDKESPSDNPVKWNSLVKNNIYKLR